MTIHSTSTTVFEPARLARLSRGLLITLRSLNGRSGDWNDVSSSRTLQIQRFFKFFEVWIRELEEMSQIEPKSCEKLDTPSAIAEKHDGEITEMARPQVTT